jgi:quercetin dioxygenase-like cupin family protein
MMKNRSSFLVLVAAAMLFTVATQAQETAMTGKNPSEMKFVKFPGLPTCFDNAVVTGDPSKGPSIILSKGSAGCTVPWHWHTPNEHVMLVSGSLRMEMQGAKAITLRAGGFSLLPSHHVHQATCRTACTLYIYGDGAFDLHYVDKDGNEIAPDAALKAVKEKTIKPAS